MNYRWNILPQDPQASEQLAVETGFPPAVCRLLTQRGIRTADEAREYFNPDLAKLHNPWLMKDMEKAVERILLAIECNERVLLFGDYDVDGTTAVACMYKFLKPLMPDGDQLEFYIPHRYREGYGVSRQGIDHAINAKRSLIISLDCGIKSVELVAYAKTAGIDFIICDHHLPDKELPVAVAILNPLQPDCNYPYKGLCGCGVGFKLISALAQRLGISEKTVNGCLDLVATAIAADIVPMTGENRILAYWGLQKVNKKPSVGIKAIREVAGIAGNMTITQVVFVIAPRVNAAGRMDDARKAVELFIEEDEERAKELANLLHNDNRQRKETDASITQEALEMILTNPSLQTSSSTVVFKDTWHKGVVGIVASRLIESHYRPTVVLTRSGDLLTGSARSVPGFNLYEAIYACREHLVAYGGHFAAAGLSLLPEKYEDFCRHFEKVVSETLPQDLRRPEHRIDSELELGEINPEFMGFLHRMEPYGPENMRPVFYTSQLNLINSRILKDVHVRLTVSKDGFTFQAIGFNFKKVWDKIDPALPFDAVYNLEENAWNGNTELQIRLIDLRQ